MTMLSGGSLGRTLILMKRGHLELGQGAHLAWEGPCSGTETQARLCVVQEHLQGGPKGPSSPMCVQPGVGLSSLALLGDPPKETETLGDMDAVKHLAGMCEALSWSPTSHLGGGGRSPINTIQCL